MRRTCVPGSAFSKALLSLSALALLALPSTGEAGCRCEGEISITLFLDNAACERNCRDRSRSVADWPDPTNALGRALEAPGGMLGATKGTTVPPTTAGGTCPTPAPPTPLFRERVTVGGVPFTIRGTRAKIDSFKALLERFRSDCLGKTIWKSLAGRFGGGDYEDGMQVFLDGGSTHAACQSNPSDRDTFSGGAAGAYDGYGMMYDAWTRTCEYTSSALWLRTTSADSLDSPDSMETFAHELTHASYDMEDGMGLREGEYCAHLAGWMVGSRLAPFPRAPMRLERTLFGPLVEEGSCGIGYSWRTTLSRIPTIEGTNGRLETYLRSCARYPADALFPSRHDSAACGGTNSSCCPFEPQTADCRREWTSRVVTSPPAASTP